MWLTPCITNFQCDDRLHPTTSQGLMHAKCIPDPIRRHPGPVFQVPSFTYVHPRHAEKSAELHTWSKLHVPWDVETIVKAPDIEIGFSRCLCPRVSIHWRPLFVFLALVAGMWQLTSTQIHSESIARSSPDRYGPFTILVMLEAVVLRDILWLVQLWLKLSQLGPRML